MEGWPAWPEEQREWLHGPDGDLKLSTHKLFFAGSVEGDGGVAVEDGETRWRRKKNPRVRVSCGWENSRPLVMAIGRVSGGTR